MFVDIEKLLESSWREVFSKNIKWSITVIIRVTCLSIFLFLFLVLIHFIGLYRIKNFEKNSIIIEPGKILNITKDGKEANYDLELKDIDAIEKLLKNKGVKK